MKKILIFVIVFIALTSCNGRAKNGARIISGDHGFPDTILIPKLKKGFIVHSLNCNDNRIVVNYLDTLSLSAEILSVDYYQQFFGGKIPSNFVIKFTNK
jgi:hypothetical protein